MFLFASKLYMHVVEWVKYLQKVTKTISPLSHMPPISSSSPLSADYYHRAKQHDCIAPFEFSVLVFIVCCLFLWRMKM